MRPSNSLTGFKKEKVIFVKNIPYLLLSIPAMLYLLVFNYFPLFGAVIAFKDYSYRKGILGSQWAGFKHFEYFFTSNDAVRVVGNTIFYSLASLIIVGIFFGIVIALMLYEVRSKLANKLFQTTMLLPFFLSWVVISGIVLLFLNPSNGFVNVVLREIGLNSVAWYTEVKYWRFILILCNVWRDSGMASLFFYAALLSIDTNLFEAAALDGAGRIRQIWYVSIPNLAPMASIVIISRLGNILGSELGMFYQVPMGSGPLYPATDVLSTFLYRGLAGGSFSVTAAVGLFQSVVGLFMVLLSNAIIKKINPDNAMY